MSRNRSFHDSVRLGMIPTPDPSPAVLPAAAIPDESHAEDSPAEAPEAQKSYARVIIQLVLILPCAVMLIPTFLLCAVGIAEALRGEVQNRNLLATGISYGLGFACMAYGVFLPERPRLRFLGILVALAGLPLFTTSALALSSRFRSPGANREIYEVLAIFGGPILVTLWNVIRIGGFRKNEDKNCPPAVPSL